MLPCKENVLREVLNNGCLPTEYFGHFVLQQMSGNPMDQLKLADQILFLTCENKSSMIFSECRTETILSHTFTFELLAVADTF